MRYFPLVVGTAALVGSSSLKQEESVAEAPRTGIADHEFLHSGNEEFGTHIVDAAGEQEKNHPSNGQKRAVGSVGKAARGLKRKLRLLRRRRLKYLKRRLEKPVEILQESTPASEGEDGVRRDLEPELTPERALDSNHAEEESDQSEEDKQEMIIGKKLDEIFLNFKKNQPWRLSRRFLDFEVAFHVQDKGGVPWLLAKCSDPSGNDSELEKRATLFLRRFLLGEATDREDEIKSMVLAAMNNCPDRVGSTDSVAEKLNQISRLGFPNRWKKAEDESEGETQELVDNAQKIAIAFVDCVEVRGYNMDYCIAKHLKGNSQGINAGSDLVLLTRLASLQMTRGDLWNMAFAIRERRSPFTPAWMGYFRVAFENLKKNKESFASLIARVIFYPEHVPEDLGTYMFESFYQKRHRYAKIMKQLKEL